MDKCFEFSLTTKTRTSGVNNAAECNELNKSHTDLGLAIHNSPDETSNKPGMKQLDNLCLNSLWGNFGQCGGF